MEGQTREGTLASSAASSGNLSVVDSDEYPDPAIFNLTDRHDQQLFMEQYQSAQQHDPQIKVAIAVFYTIIVRAVVMYKLAGMLFLAP